MSVNPLCSVLIPSYNNAQYLEQCLSSVFNQTYTNWEIIIVDDGSTDNSKALYNKYMNDKRIHLYYNETNKGCGFTKKKCIDNAHGEICLFLDSDDALVDDALKNHVQAHLEHPKASIITSRLYHCDEQLNIITEGHLLSIPEGKSYLTNGIYNPEVPSFKRDYYFKTLGLATYKYGGDDQDLIYKLEEVGDLFVLDKFTYMYRHRHCSVSQENRNITFYFNLVSQIEAVQRRGITDHQIWLDLFLSYLNINRSEGYVAASNYYENTNAYKLGAKVLLPCYFIRDVMKK